MQERERGPDRRNASMVRSSLQIAAANSRRVAYVVRHDGHRLTERACAAVLDGKEVLRTYRCLDGQPPWQTCTGDTMVRVAS